MLIYDVMFVWIVLVVWVLCMGCDMLDVVCWVMFDNDLFEIVDGWYIVFVMFEDKFWVVFVDVFGDVCLVLWELCYVWCVGW